MLSDTVDFSSFAMMTFVGLSFLISTYSLDVCNITFLFFFFKDFIYLFMRDTEREAETQAEGEADSMQGARGGT